MLDKNISVWFIRLRWCALLFGFFTLYENPAPVVLLCGLILFISNLLIKDALSSKTIGLVITLDIILLTVVLALNGGAANPFSVLYLVNITLTAAVLGANWTWLIAALSVSAFGSLFFLNDNSHMHHGSFADHLRGMWLAFALASILIAYFVSKILNSLKLKDKQVSDMQLELEKNSKFASLVTLSAGAAHELGTPLSTIALITSELARTHGKDISEDLKILESEIARCKKILDEMRAQADIASPEQWQVISHSELKELICSDINIDNLADPCYLPVFSLVKSIKCLLSNAKEAGAEEISINSWRDKNWIYFAIKDTGKGMSKETINRATEPFFTTKTKGMGLGLFLVRTFCEQLGGKIQIDSAPNEGTLITISFPLYENLKAA